MLSSTCNLNYFLFFEHPWIKFVGLELVGVFTVSQHIIFTHSPRINLVFVLNNCVVVVPSSSNTCHLLFLFIIFYIVLKSKVPQELISPRPCEIADCTKILFFSLLAFFIGRCTLYSLPSLLRLFLDLLSVFCLLTSFIGLSISLILVVWLGSLGLLFLFLFQGQLLLLLLLKLFFCFFSSVITVNIADSDLAFVIATKAVNATTFEENHSMMLSSNDLNDMISLMRIQVLNLLGICNRLSVAEPELPMVVHSPCIYLVGLVQVERVVSSTENIFCILSTCLLDLKRLFLLISCFEFAPNFARLCIAPSIHFLTFCECYCMLSSANYLFDQGFGLRIEDLRSNAGGHLDLACGLAGDDVLQ